MNPAEAIVLCSFVAIGAVEFFWRRQRPLRVLLLGAGPFAALAAKEIEGRPQLRHQIIGVVEEESASIPDSLASYPRLGAPAQLAEIVDEMRPHRILVALADRRGRLPALDLLEHQLRGVTVEQAEEAYEHLAGKLAIETLQPGSQLFREHFRCSLVQDNLARLVSLACAAVGLFFLAPVMLLIALAIKLSSPGPVLFCQQRIGLGGRPFELLKFRTMREGGGASEWVTDNKSRITAVGAFLRRARLDELPQFVNLLRGDMNLVGPRPHPTSNFELFSARIPYYSLRYLVRPGLTGWAQIRYRYANNLAEETEKMRYDLYYIKHRSAWLDLQIIPATLKAVVAGHGATGVLEQARAVEPIPTVALALATPRPLPLTTSREDALRLDWIPAAAVLRWGKGAFVAGTGALVAGTGALVKSTGQMVKHSTALVVAGSSQLATVKR